MCDCENVDQRHTTFAVTSFDGKYLTSSLMAIIMFTTVMMYVFSESEMSREHGTEKLNREVYQCSRLAEYNFNPIWHTVTF